MKNQLQEEQTKKIKEFEDDDDDKLGGGWCWTAMLKQKKR